MTHDYPPFESLNTDPDYLYIGASAWSGLVALGWAWEKKNNAIRALSPDARRAYDRNQRRNWASRGKRIA